ncbi:FAD:protein FMN transferase [Sphingomonas suaedae]|uniref:FAD:protein FMN transferase n=2 Tax=Sphingomonas suaedae TaxID=2599297 RepID=A0A518RHH7_9SPHN|nr:FAD:protein FMN transferase [Sphingomonas suaedae]
MRPLPPATFAERFVAMGTRIECHLFGAPAAAKIAADLRTAVETVDDALTVHRISPTSLLNQLLRAGKEATVDDQILWQALLLCDALHRTTHGLFDPTMGMGDARWADLEIDAVNRRVRSPSPTGLDFGGVGKGIALDACMPVLCNAGVSSALLSLGESSILAHGEHPLGGAWPLAVPHPAKADTALVTLGLVQRCVSISSTLGAANGDTFSPADGAAVRTPATTVAVDASGATAEAFSTAMLAGDAAQRDRLLSSGGCESLRRFDFPRIPRVPTGAAAGGTIHARLARPLSPPVS